MLLERDLKPLDILTRRSFENALTMVMAVGGSTNAVLHLLAIAKAAESLSRSTISSGPAIACPCWPI